MMGLGMGLGLLDPVLHIQGNPTLPWIGMGLLAGIGLLGMAASKNKPGPIPQTTENQKWLSLLQDPSVSPRLRAKAAVAIGESRDFAIQEFLLNTLRRDPSEIVRSAAAQGLGSLSHPASRTALERALKSDPSWRVRRTAAKSLGESGDPAVSPSLIGAIGDENQIVAEYALEAFAKLPYPLVPSFLVETLKKDSSPWLRRKAAKLLGESKSTPSQAELIRAFEKDPSDSVSRAALEAYFYISLKDSGWPLEAQAQFIRQAWERMKGVRDNPTPYPAHYSGFSFRRGRVEYPIYGNFDLVPALEAMKLAGASPQQQFSLCCEILEKFSKFDHFLQNLPKILELKQIEKWAPDTFQEIIHHGLKYYQLRLIPTAEEALPRYYRLIEQLMDENISTARDVIWEMNTLRCRQSPHEIPELVEKILSLLGRSDSIGEVFEDLILKQVESTELRTKLVLRVAEELKEADSERCRNLLSFLVGVLFRKIVKEDRTLLLQKMAVLIEHPQWIVRRDLVFSLQTAMNYLDAKGRSLCHSHLLELVKDSHPQVRIDALRALPDGLRKLSQKDLLQLTAKIESHLQDSNPEVRRLTALLLEKISILQKRNKGTLP